jgi:hypothetical protein
MRTRGWCDQPSAGRQRCGRPWPVLAERLRRGRRARTARGPFEHQLCALNNPVRPISSNTSMVVDVRADSVRPAGFSRQVRGSSAPREGAGSENSAAAWYDSLGVDTVRIPAHPPFPPPTDTAYATRCKPSCSGWRSPAKDCHLTAMSEQPSASLRGHHEGQEGLLRSVGGPARQVRATIDACVARQQPATTAAAGGKLAS